MHTLTIIAIAWAGVTCLIAGTERDSTIADAFMWPLYLVRAIFWRGL